MTAPPSEAYCFFQSMLGIIKLTEFEGFLTGAEFVENNPETEQFCTDFKQQSNPLLKATCEQLDEYFEGRREIFNLALKPQGTVFQRSAWEALLRIPYGETRSYLQQAQSLNNPKAIRAVGQANSRNPIAIIIPCHRVIGKNGTLTGYAGGLDRKTQLLELEQRFTHEQNN